MPEQAFFSVAQCLWWSRVSTPIIEGELLRKTILLTFNNTTQNNSVDELSNRTTNSCLANTYSLNFDKELYFYPAWPEKGRIRARWAKKSSSGGVGKELQFFCYFSPSTLPRLLCFSRLTQRKSTRRSFPQFFAPFLHSLPSGVSCTSPAWVNETENTATRTTLLIRELKEQRRRRLRKRHLKSEFALPQTLSHLFHLV